MRLIMTIDCMGDGFTIDDVSPARAVGTETL